MFSNLSQVISLFSVMRLPIGKFIFVGGSCKKISGLSRLIQVTAQAAHFIHQSKLIERNKSYKGILVHVTFLGSK